MAAVTVRVFAPHPVLAAQYTRVLAKEKNFRLVQKQDHFQVGVFDAQLDSVEAGLTLIRLKVPFMRPLLLSCPCDKNECLRWLFRGVCGLVTYDRYEEELPRAVRYLADGRLWFPASVVNCWMCMDAPRREFAHRFPLTRREREVVEFLFRRLSNKAIADILGVSERTVKFHVGNILDKLQISSRQELSASWVPDLGAA